MVRVANGAGVVLRPNSSLAGDLESSDFASGGKSRGQNGNEPPPRTSSSRPARMSLSTTFRAASPLICLGSSTPRSSRCEAAHRMMSCVSLSFDIGITPLVLVRRRLPMQPAGQGSRGTPRAWNGDSTAPFTDECQSFLDNVIAGCGQIGAWNDPRGARDETRCSAIKRSRWYGIFPQSRRMP
jgi:hypothetical protein